MGGLHRPEVPGSHRDRAGRLRTDARARGRQDPAAVRGPARATAGLGAADGPPRVGAPASRHPAEGRPGGDGRRGRRRRHPVPDVGDPGHQHRWPRARVRGGDEPGVESVDRRLLPGEPGALEAVGAGAAAGHRPRRRGGALRRPRSRCRHPRAALAPHQQSPHLPQVLRPALGRGAGDERRGVLPRKPRGVCGAPREALPGQPRPQSRVRAAGRDDADARRGGDGRGAVTLPRAPDGLPGGQLRVAALVALGARRALGSVGRPRAVPAGRQTLGPVPTPVLRLGRAGGGALQVRRRRAGRRQPRALHRLAPRRLAIPALDRRLLAAPHLSSDSKRKVLWDNCARLYKL